MESDLSKQKKLKSLSFKKFKAKTLNERKHISNSNFKLLNNLSWNDNNNLKETILDLNFLNDEKPSKSLKENINLVKTVLTMTEINEERKLIEEGKKILKKTTFQKLLSKFILECVDSNNKQEISNISDKIISISLSNPELATGILQKSIDNISTKIAPSAKDAVIIPSFTFESIGDLLKRNKRKVNGNSIINYIYNNFYNTYQAIVCEKENDGLVFGFYDVIDRKLKKSKVIDSNMNQETNNIIISTIIDEIISNNAKRAEFNISSYREILPKMKTILEKNGYYVSNESDQQWIVFEDGIENVKEMEDWNFHLDDQEDKSQDGELSPMSITMEKRPKSGMNETISVKKIKKVSEDLSPQDQQNITSALGVLSSDLASNPSSKDAPASNALNKLTAQEKDALRKTAPQSMDNSQNLGDFLTNANKELSSKGDTISKDLQGTNKNKEPITSFGTEQNTTPNTNDVNN